MSYGYTRRHRSSTLLSDWSVFVTRSEKKRWEIRKVFLFYYIPRLVVLIFFFEKKKKEVKELIQNKSISMGK